MDSRALSVFFVVSTLLVTACTGGGGSVPGSGDGTTNGTGTGNGTDATGNAGTGGEPGAGSTTTATIPDIFYGPWAYMHATLYEPGEEPKTSSVSGTAIFERDGTYEQSYTIGQILNSYQGKYEIDAKRLRTFDEQGAEAFDFRWVIGDDATIGAPVLTLYLDDDQGNPSVMYALRATNRE